MARPGDTLRLGKDTLTFLTTAAETDGAYVEVAVEYAPAVIKPPQHYHPRQTEHMRLESGRLHLQLDGTLHEHEQGADFHIPPGAVHSMWNPGPETTRVIWRTTPAYQTETVFETLWGLTNEGRLRPDGTPACRCRCSPSPSATSTASSPAAPSPSTWACACCSPRSAWPAATAPPTARPRTPPPAAHRLKTPPPAPDQAVRAGNEGRASAPP